MSFKCSVFGHRYGDPEVDREREEQGSEVVITIKETETCKRCGETRVVSENKEVTTLETPSDIVGDDFEDEDGDADDEEPTTTDEPEPAPVEEAEPTPEEPAVSGEGDDAEFIDEVEETTAANTETVDMEGPALGESEPAEPETDEDDAVILDETEGESADAEREPGQWPDEAETGADDADEAEDWAPSTGQELRPIEDEQPDVEPTANAVTVPEGEFYCPECDFTTDVESSSLRAGDFCPECHRGSLTHRSDAE